MSDRGHHDASIHQQLGQLIEANVRARDDRREMREDMGKLFEGVEAIGRQMVALNQTTTSTANIVATLSLQRCGERLDQLEKAIAEVPNIVAENRGRIHDLEVTVGTWRSWIGQGWTFAGRVVLAIIGSGVFWALVAKVAAWLGIHI